MKKLIAVLMVAGAVLASLVISQPAQAQPVQAAARIDTGSVSIFRDHGYLGGNLYTWSITGGCWGGRQIVAYILTYEIQRASSIRFFAGGRNNQDCNYLSVRSKSNGWNYQGQCVNSINVGFNFDSSHNDNSDAWVLSYNPNCRLYYAAP
jgi:hypothetical protein